MVDGDEIRPDGRPVSDEAARLRVATRALRVHLAGLPVDYDLSTTPERLLGRWAFMFARQRYDVADSLIGAGFGGTVIGSLARSLFVDGLRWLWVARDPEQRLQTLLGSLLEERNRICETLSKSGSTRPVTSRWLMPLPNVGDLTGESGSWLDAPPMPDETQLLEQFLREVDRGEQSFGQDGQGPHAELMRRAAAMFNMSGLRGAVMVLAHAGHGNYLGLQSTLTLDGAVGHDLRLDHEALFLQVAAAGTTATLLGNAASIPEAWPYDVDRDPFLERAVDLATDVADAAVPIHKLRTSRRSAAKPVKDPHPHKPLHLLPGAVLTSADLLPEATDLTPVIEATERFNTLARSMPINLWSHGNPTLHTSLTYGGGFSWLESVISTYDQEGSTVISVFAARMLLEEAARLHWRFAVEGDQEAFKKRATQYGDEFRARRRRAINSLTGGGVPRADAEAFFELPSNVDMQVPLDRITPGREKLPNITSMLHGLGTPYPQPGWLGVAYSLLSQITHSTPLGHLHVVRCVDGDWRGNDLSPEMLGLTLDVACLGAAHLIGQATVVLTDIAQEALVFRRQLHASAYAVHKAARMVHGLG